ncbi:hypothetical protein LC1Hm_2118 [Halomicrobium sp. LC1Hm]|nr:hypothetical protein LC1Hm_2118 [Halomicrobium sp. LC1Hm]
MPGSHRAVVCHTPGKSRTRPCSRSHRTNTARDIASGRPGAGSNTAPATPGDRRAGAVSGLAAATARRRPVQREAPVRPRAGPYAYFGVRSE